jgi:hypothetical protein
VFPLGRYDITYFNSHNQSAASFIVFKHKDTILLKYIYADTHQFDALVPQVQLIINKTHNGNNSHQPSNTNVTVNNMVNNESKMQQQSKYLL